MQTHSRSIAWLTPDYFFPVDARIVPELAKYYSIDWILIKTLNSQRSCDGLLSNDFQPRAFTLRYRQRDPRVIVQYTELLSSIRKSGADLLYTSFHGLPYFFPVLSLLIDHDRLIYAVHNVHTPRGASNEWAMRIYQRYAFAAAKRFHVFSKNQLRTISRLLPRKRHYYAPLATDDYGPSSAVPPADKIRFLSFGYIRRYKRLDLLIRAFQRLRAEGIRNIELLIAGRCDHWGEYESLIQDTPGIVVRAGLVPNRDIPDLVASSHYLVLPYQDSAQSAVVTLAYQYHKPVIASNIEAFADAVVPGSTGYLFDNLSVDSLTAVMKNVIARHHTMYEPLTEQVRRYVAAEYSIDHIVWRYIAFLDEALETASSSMHPAHEPV